MPGPEAPLESLRRRLVLKGVPPEDADDLVLELRDHLEDAAADLIASACPPDRAMSRAAAGLGKFRRLEAGLLRVYRSEDPIGRVPFLSAAVLPAVLLAALILLNIGLVRVGYQAINSMQIDPLITGRLAELWSGIIPYLYGLPGPLLLFAAFNRSATGLRWPALACLFFSLLSAAVSVSSGAAFGEHPSYRFVTIGFSFPPRLRLSSPSSVAALIAPAASGLAMFLAARRRRVAAAVRVRRS